MNEITLNGETYILKKKLEDRKIKRFPYSKQMKMFRIMESLGFSENEEGFTINEDKITITDPPSITLIESKSEEGANFLSHFVNDVNNKKDYDFEKFWLEYKDREDKQNNSFSNEFLNKYLSLFNIISEKTIIKTKQYAFPLVLENEHFRVVIAPRIEDEK